MLMSKLKCTTLFVAIATSVLFSGCSKNSSESFEGYGNTMSNLMSLSVQACEGEDDILFQGDSGHLYKLNKKTGLVSLICSDPACGHEDEDCVASRSVWNVQYFNGCYYFQDMFKEGYYKLDGDKAVEINHIGDSNVYGMAFIYNNRLWHKTKSDVPDKEYMRQDLLCKNFDGSEEQIIPIGEHIQMGFPQEEGIYVLTDEENLYFTNADGSGKRKLSDDQIIDFVFDGDYIYYVSISKGKEGLYNMKKDGTEVKKFSSGESMFGVCIGEKYVYYNIVYGEEKGTYMINKDGTGCKKINDEPLILSTFKNFDKLIGRYYDDTGHKDGDDMIIMNKNGSGFKKLELPVPQSVKKWW